MYPPPHMMVSTHLTDPRTLWRLARTDSADFLTPRLSWAPGTSGYRFLFGFFGFVVGSYGTLAAVSAPS